jgi:preprotein translocase subunit SecG
MLEILETPITGLHVFAALVLILIILIQPGKSGGLTAALGGAGTQQVFGGRGAGNFLTRGTWILATTFFVTSVLLAYLSSSTDDSIKSKGGKTHHSASASKKPAPAKK